MEVDVDKRRQSPAAAERARQVPERVRRRDGAQQRPDGVGSAPAQRARPRLALARYGGRTRAACSPRSRAPRTRRRRPRPCTSRRRRRASARDRHLAAASSERALPCQRTGLVARRGVARRPCVVGRGPVRVVPERPPRRRLARPLEPDALVLPGGRVRRPHERRDREAAGRRRWSAEKRAHTSSSSGRSTWQETTAYRSADVPRMPVDATAAPDAPRNRGRRRRPRGRPPAARRAPARARHDPRGVRRQERPLRHDARRPRHLRLPPRRPLRLHATALRLVPRRPLPAVRPVVGGGRHRADDRSGRHRARSSSRSARASARPASGSSRRSSRRCTRTSSGTTCT